MRVLAALLVLFTAGMVHAQDAISDSSSSTTQLPKELKTDRKDIDEEITNKKLRAATGSKALISMQSEITYNGGSVKDPFSSARPKLTPGTVGNDDSKLLGKVAGKYRMTDHDNLSLGVGVGWTKPTREGQRGQVENPYLDYARVFKTGSLQNVLEATGTYYTADKNRNEKKLGQDTTFTWNVLYTVANTKLQLGLYTSYSREYYTESVSDAALDQIGVDPYAEYALTDRYTVRTVYNGGNFNNTTSNKVAFVRDAQYQSLGIGVAVTRDIYLYPNVQWVWEDVRAERTNVALTANINL
jgi:hypothetical protein